MCYRIMVCFLLMFMLPASASPVLKSTPIMSSSQSHPCLLVDAPTLIRVKAKIAVSERYRKVADRLVAQADGVLNESIKLPAKGDMGHYTLSSYAKQLGTAYLLSGNRKYAEKAREILLKYADAYNNYPLTNLRCRVMSLSSLMEATWFQPIVLSYDAVADSGVFTPQEKRHIEQDLLRSAVKQFMIEDYAIDPRVADLHYRCYNFQAWHISCVGLVGLCLDDSKMISFAIDGPYGFKHLISHDVRDDGLFWERSLGYHAFVIQALLPFTEAAYHCGIDLYNLQVPDNIIKDEGPNYVLDGDNGPKSFRMMFDAPFYFVFPDMSYADVADSSRGPLTPDWTYKIAYHRYHDPKYAWLLHSQDQVDLDQGRVGFLHYYRHKYRYENLRISTGGHVPQIPQWDHIDGGNKVSADSFSADDGGVSTGDSYIWTKQDYRDFVLEWDMIREAESGSADRTIVVWHVKAGNSGYRKQFFLAGYCPEIGKKYHFRLEVKGRLTRLLRDGLMIESQPSISAPDAADFYDLCCDQPKVNEGSFRLSDSETRLANTGSVRDGCSFYPSSGFAILREQAKTGNSLPDPRSLALNFNCGPYGGGHGHPDKLSIVLYANERQWLPDFGSCGYDSQLKGEWTAQTVSHNTVVVDKTSQYPSGPTNPIWPTDTADKRALGQIDIFHANALMKVTSGWSDSVYPGVHMRRTLVHLGQSILDVFSLKSSEPHTYDYVLHVDGVLAKSDAAVTSRPGRLGDKSGYQHITNVKSGMIKTPWTSIWRQGADSLRLYTLAWDGTEIFVADSITTAPLTHMPMVLLRRNASDTTFVSVMQPSEVDVVRRVAEDNSLLIQTGISTSRVFLHHVKDVFEGDLGIVTRPVASPNSKTDILWAAALINGTRLRVEKAEITTSEPMTLFVRHEKDKFIVVPGSNAFGRVTVSGRSVDIKPGDKEITIEIRK